MNVGRAKQILESADFIDVTCEGKPVIIQHVDEQAGTARVYIKEKPDAEHVVQVVNLQEV